MADSTGMDERRRADNIIYIRGNSTQVLCHRCGGTGNELFSMYRACIDCSGSGLVAALDISEDSE